jgi:type VI secretion system protein ImpH
MSTGLLAPSRREPEVVELDDTAPPSRRLFAEPQQFDFFQAVRLLEALQPGRRQIASNASPDEEFVHFKAALGASFPASSIADLSEADDYDGSRTPPEMTIAFLGLTGPSGALPAHYTELLWRLNRDVRTPEKHALRAWFDLFNHRLVSLFYRAWEKYRPWVAYQRGEYQQPTPDVFTQGLFSFAGLARQPRRDEPGTPLAFRLPHALVRYAGLLAQRPRTAANLEALLVDYFSLPVEVEQFAGQWLALDAAQQTRLGLHGQLGFDSIVGTAVWDRQSKVRIRVGPLNLQQFTRLLPESRADGAGPRLAELLAVVNFYLGSELDFDVQLILRGEEVPDCRLGMTQETEARLGWNTWLAAPPAVENRSDATFAPAS